MGLLDKFRKETPNEALAFVAKLEKKREEIETALDQIALELSPARLAAFHDESTASKKELEKLNQLYSDKQKELTEVSAVLEDAKNLHRDALDLKKRTDSAAVWAEERILEKQIMDHALKYEKHQADAVEEIKALMKKVHKAVTICPATDGTRHFDSLLSNEQILAHMKLEIRRHGLLLVTPWFKDENQIPRFSVYLKEGLGWLNKFRPEPGSEV